MSPQVSVVMPVFKPDFLSPAIDSVLAQTMRDFELIVVNDGSPDGQVKAICSSYRQRDKRIRYIEQKNQGLAGARNTGAAAAKTNYLMWMDDDDVSLPDRMKEQFHFLKTHQNMAAVNCPYFEIDKQGGKIKRRFRDIQIFPKIDELLVQNTPPVLSDVPKPLMATGPRLMVKKSAFDAIGGMRPWFRISEDADFALRLEEEFPVAMLPTPLYLYRLHSSPRQLTKDKGFPLYTDRQTHPCHLYTSPSPRDRQKSRMPSSA